MKISAIITTLAAVASASAGPLVIYSRDVSCPPCGPNEIQKGTVRTRMSNGVQSCATNCETAYENSGSWVARVIDSSNGVITMANTIWQAVKSNRGYGDGSPGSGARRRVVTSTNVGYDTLSEWGVVVDDEFKAYWEGNRTFTSGHNMFILAEYGMFGPAKRPT